MVRVTGGEHGLILISVLIFKIVNHCHPITEVPDAIPDLCYRSSLRRWMDGWTWKEWLNEACVLKKSIGGSICNLCVDNFPSHIDDFKIKESLCLTKTQVHKLLVNSTEKTQASYPFVLQKIKDSWGRNWDKH